MTTLRESAKAYQPLQTRNVAELEAVSLDAPIVERKAKDKDGKEFTFNVTIGTNGEEYRIPDSVLKDIKTILETKPNTKTVRVVKKGTGMGTTYTTIPLE